MNRLLDPDQVAEIVGLSPLTIRRALRAGELTGTKLRGRWRVDPGDVATWVEENRHRPDGAPLPGRTMTPRRRQQVPDGGFRALARREAS